MAVSLKHQFVSAVADGADTSLVRPSNWNAEHALTMATERLLGRTTASAGDVEEISAGTNLSLSAGSLSVTASPSFTNVTATTAAILGSGDGTGTLSGGTLRSPDASGTNVAGSNLTLAGGNGTGTGGGGYIAFRTAAAGSTGTTANTLSERARIDNSGRLGVGVTAPTALLMLGAGTATADTGPLKFTSGTNLSTPEAGSVEYDGTIITATSNTNFKRGTVPITNYSSGAGTSQTANQETTLRNILPSANDTITLSAGTYLMDIAAVVTRTGSSTTSATAALNILGSGSAAGSFSGVSSGTPTAVFSFDATNINATNTLTAASTTAGGSYVMTLRAVLRITSGGTIVPQYNLSATLGSGGNGGASSKVLYFILQQLDTQSGAAFGPAGTGWG